MRQIIVFAIALGAIACGYTDGGGGTRTLEVSARLTYQAHDDEMRVEITVEKEGIPVNDAEVEVTDGQTDEVFIVEQANVDSPYTMVKAAGEADTRSALEDYHRRIALSVKSGTDRVEGQLEGPGVHWVVKPENGKPMSRGDIGDELEVKWETEDGIAAREVTVRVDSFTHTIRDYEDPGQYNVPGNEFDDGETRIQVTRANQVKLDGGVGDSKIVVDYEARSEIPVN